ncbi:Rab-GTPase-TBC domain protein [Pelomyxa schiedti]|nr:Rab-GTPase-TBC domain protein [Pelomyxa schiedti]
MIGREGFIDEEHESALFAKDFGFLQANRAEIIERALKWSDIIQATAQDASPSAAEVAATPSATTTTTTTTAAAASAAVSSTATESAASGSGSGKLKAPRPYTCDHGLTPPRIVILDAERTFVDRKNINSLVKFLTFVDDEFGDYAQGMAFFAAALLLVLEEDRVLSILRTVGHNKRFLPGYWQTEAVKYATDAYYFEHLLKKHFPQIATHLANNYIVPEMFCSKWFVGLCVHVLPFEHLFNFFEGFFREGKPYLFKFGLSLVEQLLPQLESAPDTSRLLEVLRLEKLGTVDLGAIISGTSHFDVQTGPEYEALCAELYETKLRKRIEAARRQQEEDSEDEITFSDEED